MKQIILAVLIAGMLSGCSRTDTTSIEEIKRPIKIISVTQYAFRVQPYRYLVKDADGNLKKVVLEFLLKEGTVIE